MNALSFHNVSKSFATGPFKKKKAVDDISFEVETGKIIGLMGANGSGKSTLIKMAMGFLNPSQGHIEIFGKANTPAQRGKVGYVPENPRFSKFVTPAQILAFFADLYGIPKSNQANKIEEVLKQVELLHVLHEKVGGFSKGMTQRLAISQALLCQPDLLLMDEPMSGLDPLGRQLIKDIIVRVKSQSPHSTIFFTSHVLSDVAELCERFFLLRQGRLERFFDLDQFQKEYKKTIQVKFFKQGSLTHATFNNVDDMRASFHQANIQQEDILSIQLLHEHWDDHFRATS